MSSFSLRAFFLATLFLICGWRKVKDYSGTVSRMVQLCVPTPVLVTVVAIFMELPVAFAVAVCAFARPLTLLYVAFSKLGNPRLSDIAIGQVKGAVSSSTAWIVFNKNCSIMEASLIR